MRNWRCIVGALAVVPALAACIPIGQDFRRPDEGNMHFNETTTAQVIGAYGDPRRQKAWGRTDDVLASEVGSPQPFGAARATGTMREIYYYHQNRMGEGTASGVEASKSAYFWFFNDRLVGYLAHSSFLQDSTLFDDARARAIVPWKSLREDVYRALGPPSGIRVFPLVAHEGQEVLTYFAFEFDRGANETRTKRLHILVNALGVVENTRFDSSAKPIPPPPPSPAVITVPVYTPPRRGR